jgi:hypothetical protein
MKNTLKNIYNYLYNLFYISKLESTSPNRDKYLSLLLDEVKDLSFINLDGIKGAELEWSKNVNKIIELILTKSPNEFLTWSPIKHTMFVVRDSFV